MKQIRIILASNKKLIVQSIDCVFSYKSGLEVVAKVYKVDQLIDCLKSVPADILLLDQQMLDELYVWKNKTPKLINPNVKILLLIDKYNDRSKGSLPGFNPDRNAYWEKGPSELINEILQMFYSSNAVKTKKSKVKFNFYIHGFNLN